MSAAGAAPAGALPPFFRLHRFASLPSSNDEAKRLAAAGAPEGTLVLAGRQTAGRGRAGRRWVSAPGNLYCSLLLRPGVPPGRAAQLSFVASLAVAEAVAPLPGCAGVRLKWPNDVLAGGRKLAGILLESVSAGDGGVDFVVAGIGVNVRHAPTDPAIGATCLAALGARTAEPWSLLLALAPALEAWYGRWRAGGFKPVREAWLQRAAGLGGPVRVRTGAGEVVGRLLGLDEEGGLVLSTAGGGQRIVTAGEVDLLPA